MRTLYVTDLDGTLLRKEQCLSEYTIKTLNALIEKGMLFSYASARSSYSASKVTKGLNINIPVILQTGVMIKDLQKGILLKGHFFQQDKVAKILEEMMKKDVHPVVYSVQNDEEKFSYQYQKINNLTKEFLSSRQTDPRNHPVESMEELTEGNLFYITTVDQYEKLVGFYEKYKEEYHCVFQREYYSQEYWLEIMPKDASKANGVKELAELLHADKIVVFGDSMNDIDMFAVADEAYAVENAMEELKQAATGVIGSNEEDGEAKWLYEHACIE